MSGPRSLVAPSTFPQSQRPVCHSLPGRYDRSDRFELELDERFEEEFDELFEDELELEFEELLDEELELELLEELELELDELLPATYDLAVGPARLGGLRRSAIRRREIRGHIPLLRRQSPRMPPGRQRLPCSSSSLPSHLLLVKTGPVLRSAGVTAGARLYSMIAIFDALTVAHLGVR